MKRTTQTAKQAAKEAALETPAMDAAPAKLAQAQPADCHQCAVGMPSAKETPAAAVPSIHPDFLLPKPGSSDFGFEADLTETEYAIIEALREGQKREASWPAHWEGHAWESIRHVTATLLRGDTLESISDGWEPNHFHMIGTAATACCHAIRAELAAGALVNAGNGNSESAYAEAVKTMRQAQVPADPDGPKETPETSILERPGVMEALEAYHKAQSVFDATSELTFPLSRAGHEATSPEMLAAHNQADRAVLDAMERLQEVIDAAAGIAPVAKEGGAQAADKKREAGEARAEAIITRFLDVAAELQAAYDEPADSALDSIVEEFCEDTPGLFGAARWTEGCAAFGMAIFGPEVVSKVEDNRGATLESAFQIAQVYARGEESGARMMLQAAAIAANRLIKKTEGAG